MAQFRAVIQGARGEASRLGSKHSNMYVSAQSWEGQINVVMWHAANYNGTHQDMVRITLGPHAQAADNGNTVVLYEGPCDAWKHQHERRLSLAAIKLANDNLAKGQDVS